MQLDAYLQRIGYTGDLSPSAAVLEALHLAHATHIPFENLDILRGLPIRLDLESLQRKLVDARRGGYCFEQNLLFAAALEAVGFPVTRLAARVRYRTASVLPRTHMLMLVNTDGGRWLADVGFGAEGLLLPVPFDSGQESRQFAWTYRVVPGPKGPGLGHEGPSLPDVPEWVLQSKHAEGWADMYGFTLEPQLLVDYEVANHFTSTHPDSVFRRTLTIQRSARDGRLILRGDTLTRYKDGQAIEEAVAPERVRDVARELFGVELPERLISDTVQNT